VNSELLRLTLVSREKGLTTGCSRRCSATRLNPTVSCQKTAANQEFHLTRFARR